MSRSLPSWMRHPHLLLAGCALLVLACATARAFRLNPGEEPARYRIVCRDSSRQCDRLAKEQCEGEYTVLSREMSRTEQDEVDDSNLSSTGPSEGFVGWRAELVVHCGRELPELRLVRPEEAPAEPAASATASNASAPASRPPARWCVPGVTQACLGPGACSGAQACLRDGSGFGPCDCGEKVPSSSAVPLSSAVPPSSAVPSSSAVPPSSASGSTAAAASGAAPLAPAAEPR